MSGYARTLPENAKEAQGALKILERQIEQIRLGMQLGVTIAVGTDSGSRGVNHGRAVSEEITLFEQAGMPIEKAIQCATSNGARLLGLDRQLGTLTPGMPATFVVLKGGPKDIPNSLITPLKVYIQH
jgi:imidazolonepropionase-like amidohydrolase